MKKIAIVAVFVISSVIAFAGKFDGKYSITNKQFKHELSINEVEGAAVGTLILTNGSGEKQTLTINGKEHDGKLYFDLVDANSALISNGEIYTMDNNIVLFIYDSKAEELGLNQKTVFEKQ